MMLTVSRNRRQMRGSATAAVRARMRTLSRQLRDVAAGRLSTKALHELRIACRRAEAALRLCREVADSRACRWLHKHLRTLRRACNDARDCDVLFAWIKRHDATAAKHWGRELQAQRQALQPLIVKLAARLTEDRSLNRHSKSALRRLRDCERSGRVASAFGRRLFSEVHRFVLSLPVDREDSAALHQLRIIGKRLRYASEIVTEVWPDIELAELREHVQTLQKRLGAIHDQQVGQQRLQKLYGKQSGRSIGALLQRSRDTCVREQRRFWRWWRACPLERMLADTTAELLTLIRQKPRADAGN